MVDKIRYATPQQLFASGKDCLRKQPQGISSKMQQYRNNIYISFHTTSITGNTYIEREDIKQHTTTMQFFFTESQKLLNLCK